MSEDIFLGPVFGCVGFILIALALFFLLRTRSFINRSRQAQGTITQMVYSSDSDGGGYTPVFRFRTLEGQAIEVSGGLRSNPPQFKVGQIIEVLYDPESPQNARIRKWLNLYFVSMLLGFLGLVFGCIGVVAAFSSAFDYFN